MYSIELPDGTLMEDIPDDVNPKDALTSWVNKTFQVEHGLKADPTEGMSSFQKFAAGVGKGITDVGINTAQLLTPERFEEGLGISDEQQAVRAERDTALTDTAQGAVGQFVGESIPAIATGMGAGALVAKVGTGAAKSLAAMMGTKLPKSTKLAQSVLAGRPTVYAAEGAAAGAVADPDSAEGAKRGALIGGGLGVAGSVLNRVGQGLVRKSEKAKRLEELTGETLPLNIAAEEGGMKTFYNKVMPFFPLTGARMSNQVNKAAEAIEVAAAKAASPGGATASSVDDVVKALDKGYKESVGTRSFASVGDDIISGPSRVSNKANKIVNEYVDNGVLKGNTIHVIRTRLADLVRKNPLDSDYRGIVEQFDKFVIGRLSRNPKGQMLKADLKQETIDAYTALNKSMDGFFDLSKGADEISALAKDIMPKIDDKNVFQILAANAVGRSLVNAAGVGGAIAAPPVAASMAATGLAFTRPYVQRKLMEGSATLRSPALKKGASLIRPVVAARSRDEAQDKDKYGSY